MARSREVSRPASSLAYHSTEQGQFLWLDQFNPEFTGLTGTLAAIAAAAAAAGIPVGAPVRQPDGSYTLDHGTEMLAFTPDNRAHLAFFPSTPPAGMARDLRLLVAGQHP